MKSMIKPSIIISLLLASASLNAFSQAQKELQTDFAITKIDANLVKTPQISIGIGPIKNTKSRDWLEVEVEFAWQPVRNDLKYTDELTFAYYILLNNKSAQNPQNTLLTGQVTHVAIAAGKGMRSVMYVSPRTLERFFEGRVPANIQVSIVDVGVTITKQGQLVAFKSLHGSGPWWSNYQQTAGYVLNKNETPFAPLFWDYYEAIKSRPAGL
ncbi:MAG: Amuc_1102 family pilus-like protein [Chthoniobacterales bacterium]